VRRERPDRALEFARRNAEQRPTDVQAQLRLGQLLAITNHEEEAEQRFRKAAELAPANPGGWNGLLALAVRSGSRERIEGMLRLLEGNTAIETGQKSLLLGQAQAALGNVADARRSFAQAGDQLPNDLAAQLFAAQSFMQVEPERAKLHLKAALRIDPKSVAA